MKIAAAALLACMLALMAASCGSDSDSESEAGSGVPTIAATTGIWADVTEQLAGDDAEVVQVIPDSSTPHDFQLSAQDRAEIEDASLLVLNGAALEEGVPFDEIETEQFAVTDNVTELLASEEGEEHSEEEGVEHAEEGEEEAHEGEDPHVWMDPTRVAEALPALADAMADADPDNADAYRERAGAFAAELTALDGELEKTLAAVPAGERNLVTSHDALGYFADRYGFDVVATAFPASGAEGEASAGQIAEVEEAVRSTGVPALFAEEEDDPEVLNLVADETGVVVIEDLLVESPGDGSYVEMLRQDARLIADALSAGAGGA